MITPGLMKACVLVLIASLGRGPSFVADKVQVTENMDLHLTLDEVKILKGVYSKDSFLRELIKSQALLSQLNTILSKSVVGPVSLVLKWDQALFDGWAKANSNLSKIEHLATCDDLSFPAINDSPNQEFFNKLKVLRECED